ncbi:MAG: bile acid:sodium symporter family protein [Nitrospirota bacterium]|nr:bile acid:sodium symporter family protein [Nitrospirota bacterium]
MTGAHRLARWAGYAQDGFVIWVVLGAAWGYAWPEAAAPGKGWIPEALAVVMLGMGLTLRPSDVAALRHAGRAVLTGIGLQFLVMPLAAWGVARTLGLPPELAVGLLLVGAAPGGTASNVVAFLARGDVALSVTMTTASTLLAPLLTPLWVGVLAATWIDIDPLLLALTVAKIVLAPVAAGVLLRRWWTPAPWLPERLLPLLSMAAIVWIVGVITALNHDRLGVAPLVLLAVVLVNATGLALGYAGARAAGLPERARRTVALEVGMQNSGLAVALAVVHFGPLAAIPGALFSIWHNISGPLLAVVWRRNPP